MFTRDLARRGLFYPRPSSDGAAAGNDVDVDVVAERVDDDDDDRAALVTTRTSALNVRQSEEARERDTAIEENIRRRRRCRRSQRCILIFPPVDGTRSGYRRVSRLVGGSARLSRLSLSDCLTA